MRDAASRLQAAGWITHFAPSATGLTMAWTPKGKEAAQALLGLYHQLTDGQHIEPETLNCIVVLASISEDSGEVQPN